MVITKDSDFKNSHFIKHSPKKLIKINLGNISTNNLINILENILDKLILLFDGNQNCYVEINQEDIVVIPN